MIHAWKVARARLHVTDSVEVAVIIALGRTPSACLVASVRYVAAKVHHDLQTDATDFTALGENYW